MVRCHEVMLEAGTGKEQGEETRRSGRVDKLVGPA